MLSLRLRLGDLCSPNWTWVNGQWANGDSWIRPIQSPALASRLVHDRAGRVGVIVRERVDTSVASDHQPNAVVDVDVVLSEAHTLSVESMTVRFEPERVVLTSGPFGTAPLFVAARQDLFIGSWHLPELAPLIQADQLLDRAVTRRLTRQSRYTTDTVLSGIHRLTERATAVFTRSGVSLSYPEPAGHVLRPRDLRPGIDAVAALGELLTDVLVHTPAALGPVGAELSGGVDSANVALTLAAMRAQPLSSYGLILDGVVGDQQRRRRSAMVHHFGLRDSTVPAYDHPPFVPTGSRGLGRPHDPTSASTSGSRTCGRSGSDGRWTS